MCDFAWRDSKGKFLLISVNLLSVVRTLTDLDRCLLALTDKLRRCHGSGKITSYLRAQRDAKVLLDCDSELNATVDDMKVAETNILRPFADDWV